MPIRIRRREVLLASVMMIVCDLMEAPRSAQASGNSTWLVSYQGKLVGAGGLAATGAHTLVFSITSPTNIAWTETQTVTTTSGLFHVLLGQVTPFPEHLFSGGPVDLQITVDGKAMAPNTHLSGSPYAFEALHSAKSDMAAVAQSVATGAVTSDSIKDGSITASKLSPGATIPVGGVIAWWGDSGSLPDAWMVCDGSVVNDSVSPLKGQTLPDLRNRFVRGATGNIRANAPTGGSDTETLSADQMPQHTHAVHDPGHHHVVNDPGHTHGVADPGHTHGVTDPGHSHSAGVAIGWGTAGSNPGWGRVDANGGDPSHGWATWTNPSATGISVQGSGSSISVQGSASGISNADSTTSISIQDSGGGRSFNTVPSYVGLVYIMRVR